MNNEISRSLKLRLIDALQLLTELQEGFRGVGVMHQYDGSITLPQDCIMSCCQNRGIEANALSLQDVAHFGSHEHIAVSFGVSETQLRDLERRINRLIFADSPLDSFRGH